MLLLGLLGLFGCSGKSIDEKFSLDPSSRDVALAKNFFKKGLDAQRRGDFLDAEINFLKAEVLIGQDPSIREARSLNKELAAGSSKFQGGDLLRNPSYTALADCLESATCPEVVEELNQIYCKNFELDDQQAIVYFALGGKVLDTPFCKNERLKQEILRVLDDSKYFSFKKIFYSKNFSRFEFRMLALTSAITHLNLKENYNLIPNDVLELVLAQKTFANRPYD